MSKPIVGNILLLLLLLFALSPVGNAAAGQRRKDNFEPTYYSSTDDTTDSDLSELRGRFDSLLNSSPPPLSRCGRGKWDSLGQRHFLALDRNEHLDSTGAIHCTQLNNDIPLRTSLSGPPILPFQTISLSISHPPPNPIITIVAHALIHSLLHYHTCTQALLRRHPQGRDHVLPRL